MKIFENYLEEEIEKIINSHLIDFIDYFYDDGDEPDINEMLANMNVEDFLYEYFDVHSGDLEDYEEFRDLCESMASEWFFTDTELFKLN